MDAVVLLQGVVNFGDCCKIDSVQRPVRSGVRVFEENYSLNCEFRYAQDMNSDGCCDKSLKLKLVNFHLYSSRFYLDTRKATKLFRQARTGGTTTCY